MRGHWLDEEAQFCDLAIAMIRILAFHMRIRIMLMNRYAKLHSRNGISMKEVELLRFPRQARILPCNTRQGSLASDFLIFAIVTRPRSRGACFHVASLAGIHAS